jgi:diguanylate cyclase (GGDEF)-like protein
MADRTAKEWIGLVLSAGGASLAIALVAVLQPGQLADFEQPAFWVFLVAASVAHAFPVIAPRHQAYHATQAILMASVLLLNWPAVAAIVVATHITEWLRRRRPWYIQLYNVAVYLLSAGVAKVVIGLLGVQAFALDDARALAAAVCAAGAWLLMNHGLTAAVLWLARGVSVADSGLFGRESMGIDGALLVVGIVIAGAWVEQPAAAILAAAPLALMYRALRVANLDVSSHRDPLTGLYNRRHYQEALELELRRAEHLTGATGLVLIVLDDVPTLIQAYGRATLDFLVLAVAQRLSGEARAFDLVARLGEGRLGVLLPDSTRAEVHDVARRMLGAADKEPFAVATTRQPLVATVSLVVASVSHAPSRVAGGLVDALIRVGERAAIAGPRALIDAAAEIAAVAAQPVPANMAAARARVQPPAVVAVGEQRVPGFIRLWHLEAVVILPGLASTVAAVLASGSIDPILAAGILVLVALSELLAFELYDRTSFSISFAPILAAGLLGGPPATLLATWSVAVLRGVLRHSRWDKVMFNGATYSLFGLASTAIVTSVGANTASPWQLSMLVAATLVASSLYYLHTFVIAAVLALDVHIGVIQVWARNFRWLFPHYLVLGALGLGLALATLQFGAVGSVLFMAPLVMMRFVLKQYTDRTKGAVERLEAANADLVAVSSLLRHRGYQLALLSDLGHLAAHEPRSTNLPLLVVERCVPALGDVCAVIWRSPGGLQSAVHAVASATPLAAVLRAQPAESVAELAQSMVGGSPLPEWTAVWQGRWCALPLTGVDQPFGWILTWGAESLPEPERADRSELMHEVAGRLALVLERDALLEEAAAVDAQRAIDRAKSDFVAVAAHELRTPLTSVQGYTELLRNEVAPDLRNRWLNILQVETAQLGVVLDQLLDASQLDAGQFHAERSAFEVEEVVRRTVEEFTPQARLTGHRLQIDLASGLPRAVADATQVNRVLRSLISNALKYSPQGGEIWVVAAPRSDVEIELCVQDQGLGIPPEWLDRLFARFQRVDLPDRASLRGTGLGLYIARQFVEVNGGRIWAESDGAGRGARFHFTLMAAPSARRAPGPAARTA